jgi:hypothetical protein
LDWHQRELSSASFDFIAKYYLNKEKKHVFQGSFLLAHEVLNFEAFQLLKKRLREFIDQKKQRISMLITQKQFLEFKEQGIQELIFWHGNQFLTGAPFYPGGITPVIYFQWGNYFGIIKYTILFGEKALKANLLVCFEDMYERKIEQCILDSEHHLKDEITHQNTILLEHGLQVEPLNHFLMKGFHLPSPAP